MPNTLIAAPDSATDKQTPAVVMPEPVIPYGHASQYDSLSTWVFSGIGALIAASFWVRRRVSRDNTEISKDRAETDIVQVLREERDKAMGDARDAWNTRTADAMKIAHLESENTFLKRDVEALKARVNELSDQLALALSAIRTMKPDFTLHISPSQPA